MSAESSMPHQQPHPVPAGPGEALEIVRSRFGQPTLPDGTPVPLRVEEEEGS